MLTPETLGIFAEINRESMSDDIGLIHTLGSNATPISFKDSSNTRNNVSDSIDEVYPYKKENNCVCSFKDDELRVTVLIKVKQGCDVVKKCNLLQSKIKEAIAGMTGIECKSVDIDIQGFVTEK